jgi:hypothetical protein
MIPQVSTHAVSHFPHAIREPAIHAAVAHFGGLTDVPESVRLRRRPASVPLMPRRPAGFPSGACVHRRRPAIA